MADGAAKELKGELLTDDFAPVNVEDIMAAVTGARSNAPRVHQFHSHGLGLLKDGSAGFWGAFLPLPSGGFRCLAVESDRAAHARQCYCSRHLVSLGFQLTCLPSPTR